MLVKFKSSCFSKVFVFKLDLQYRILVLDAFEALVNVFTFENGKDIIALNKDSKVVS
jgi:hypothetical protein